MAIDHDIRVMNQRLVKKRIYPRQISGGFGVSVKIFFYSLPLEKTFIAAIIPIGMAMLATTSARLGSNSINQFNFNYIFDII